MLESATVVRDAIVQGVNTGIFGVRTSDKIYFKQPIPPSAVEYGAVLVRESELPPPPSTTLSSPSGRVAPEELVSALHTAAEVPVREVYKQLWARRRKEFADESTFRRAFCQALTDGAQRNLFILEGSAAAESPDWDQLLEIAKIKKPEIAPPQPPQAGVQTYSLRAGIPLDKLSDFVRGVITPLRNDGAEVTVEVSIEARSQPGGFKKTTLDQKVRETLQQIGADIRHESLH